MVSRQTHRNCYNVCFIKIRTKNSSNTLLSLVRFFMKQTLVSSNLLNVILKNNLRRIWVSKIIRLKCRIYSIKMIELFKCFLVRNFVIDETKIKPMMLDKIVFIYCTAFETANSAYLGRFFCTGQQELWRGTFNFKIIFSRPLFTIIFKPKMVISRLRILVHLFWLF